MRVWLPIQGMRVQPLVGKAGSHMPANKPTHSRSCMPSLNQTQPNKYLKIKKKKRLSLEVKAEQGRRGMTVALVLTF